MKWNIAASFFSPQSRWLDDFCDNPNIEFQKISPVRIEGSWHERAKRTGLLQWLDHFRQAIRAVHDKPTGVITCFPQLALTVSITKFILRRRSLKIIAWNFNLGVVRGRLRGNISGFFLNQVDLLIVHSRAEIDAYSKWLGIPARKFVFVPLPRGKVETTKAEDVTQPFIVAMGSAGRDYETLVRAIQNLKIRTIIVAKREILDNIGEYPWLEKKTNLSQQECLDLSCRARINVVPIGNMETASGQVTVVNAAQMGRALIATRCIGTEDYIIQGETGLLVEPFSVGAMEKAIKKLWSDDSLRNKMAQNAARYSAEYFSDEAAAQTLIALIKRVTGD